METGWIKIHRKLRKKSYYNKSHYVHLWVELLLLASHGDTEFMWNGKTQKLNKGQFVTGRKQLSAMTGIPETSVERLLTFFEKDAQIGQQKNNKFRLITILNWESHQQNGQQADNKRTTDGHIQELKNVKKGKKIPTALQSDGAEKFSQQGAEVIKTFALFVNPACKSYYNRPPQRVGADKCIEMLGLDRVLQLIQFTLPKTNKIPYLPTIMTPLQLYERYSALDAGMMKIKNKNVEKPNYIL